MHEYNSYYRITIPQWVLDSMKDTELVPVYQRMKYEKRGHTTRIQKALAIKFARESPYPKGE